MNSRRRSDAELDSLIDEITVDCHDEDEQLSAFENAFYDATFPCGGAVIGEEVDVLSVGIVDGRRELIAACERSGRRYEVALLDITIDADEDIARLLAAYRQWLRGFG
jgi:hypothetical protein